MGHISELMDKIEESCVRKVGAKDEEQALRWMDDEYSHCSERFHI